MVGSRCWANDNLPLPFPVDCEATLTYFSPDAYPVTATHPLKGDGGSKKGSIQWSKLEMRREEKNKRKQRPRRYRIITASGINPQLNFVNNASISARRVKSPISTILQIYKIL